MLLEAWKEFERDEGDEKSQAEVQQLLPRRVKKRRKIQSEDGSDQGWEEYFEYIFPEDEADKPNLKLLAMAKMWKKNKADESEKSLSDQHAEPKLTHNAPQNTVNSVSEESGFQSNISNDENIDAEPKLTH